jgi:hypothetical protein
MYIDLHIFEVGGEWSTSLHGSFNPGERAIGTHWIGDWVGPKVGLEDVDRRKTLPLHIMIMCGGGGV